jgi:predicted nucleic acid-binding Zn ribbon protein
MKSFIMRKSNTRKIGDVIKEYLEESGLKRKLNKSRIINHWEELVGKAVAKRTTSVYIKNKTLFVSFNSSVVKNELMMMRQQIIDTLNKYAGETIIENIVIR